MAGAFFVSYKTSPWRERSNLPRHTRISTAKGLPDSTPPTHRGGGRRGRGEKEGGRREEGAGGGPGGFVVAWWVAPSWIPVGYQLDTSWIPVGNPVGNLPLKVFYEMRVATQN